MIWVCGFEYHSMERPTFFHTWRLCFAGELIVPVTVIKKNSAPLCCHQENGKIPGLARVGRCLVDRGSLTKPDRIKPGFLKKPVADLSGQCHCALQCRGLYETPRYRNQDQQSQFSLRAAGVDETSVPQLQYP